MTDISILTSNRTFSRQQFDGVSVVSSLLWLQEECQERMMTDAVKWTAEVLQFVPEQWISDFEKEENPSSSKEKPRITLANRSVTLARSLCYTKEFARACYYLSKVKNDNPVNKFLYYWSRYLMCEKIKLENEAEAIDHKITSNGFENKDDHDLAELLRDMSNENLEEFDAFLYYLLAKIERSIGSNAGAFASMKKAISLEPRLWPAWDEIVELIPTPNDVHAIYCFEKQGCSSWMSDWFASLALRHFNYDRQAAEKMEQLLTRGFPNVPTLLSHRAAMADRMLEHTNAIDLFMKLREMDPLRIEDMHLYCDSLFCMSERTELTSLTHSFYKTHKFYWETAYIVGNYYTIRGEHEQAIRFFQRALRLNPKQASIWVVIGHEFVELKNNSAACLAYRRAIEIDPREYRAWYGLGQLYDILKMNVYALYYYQEAHKCRPNDSRILVALGLIYSKMERSRDALKCFTAAHKNGDVEGTALWHLAKIFEREDMMDKAARTYEEYLNALDSMEMVNDNVPYIIQFLAKHYFGKGEWDKSKKFAERCLLCDSIAEEGRKILRDIATQEEEEFVNVPTTAADVSADMQISDGEENVSYD